MMSQATVEEDGVSWIDEGGSGPCHETGLESSNLSPAEVNRIVLKSGYWHYRKIIMIMHYHYPSKNVMK